MRAMILAAGLGSRLRPLTHYRAKPALPVCGRPVISLLLELLSRHGVRETLINLHYLPDSIREAVDRDHPESMRITWSEEGTPLGTGGGIRRAAEFLSQTPECLVMAGDMLLDFDLGALQTIHRESGRDVSLILRSDPRGRDFGTIGIDDQGRVTRIGQRHLAAASGKDPATEAAEGLFTGVRFFSRGCLQDWPTEEAFEDLRDWLAPRMERGEIEMGGEILPAQSSVWEPVGTPEEYLAANLNPPALPSLGGAAAAWHGALKSVTQTPFPSVISATATVAGDAKLEGCVVWDEEHVPAGFRGRHGVYAGDAFHPCGQGANGSLQ